MIVRERIEFERGKDPKRSMDVGLSHVHRKIIDETHWGAALDPTVYDIVTLIPDYMGHPILVVEVRDPITNRDKPYTAVSDFIGSFAPVQPSPEVAIDVVKHSIRNRETKKKKNESLEFERGKDPKRSLRVGRARILKEIDDWVTPKGSRSYYKAIEDRDYEGCVMVLYGSIDASKEHYYVVIRYPNGSIHETRQSHESPESAWRDAKDTIDKEKFAIETGYWEAAGITPTDYFKPIDESLEFERGKDPKEGIGVGMKAFLEKRSLKNLVGPASNSKRIAAEIGGEFMFDIDLSKIYLLTKSGDNIWSRKNSLFDPKMWKALEPHLSEYNIKHTRSTGAGVDTTIYETPYGKVVREHNNIGVDQYWAEFDTYMGLLNSLNESQNFERGIDPKEAMKVGKRTNAIQAVYLRKLHKGEGGTTKVPLTRNQMHQILRGLSSGKMSADKQKNYEITYYVEDEELGLQDRRNLHAFSGEYILLDGIYYLIPYINYNDEYVKESMEFERGKDPKNSMGIGHEARMEREYGRLWKVFKRCCDLSHISPNFEWASEIQYNEKDPYFNIESYFYYTDDEGSKYPLQFVVTLHPDEIFIEEVVNDDGSEIFSVGEFVDFTDAFENREDWEGLFESEFERGKDPRESIGVGLKSQIYQGMYNVAMGIPGVLGMEIREDVDSDRVFLKIKYIGNIKSGWKEKVNKYLGKYVQLDKTPGVEGNYYFEIHPEYVKYFKEILEEDSKK